MTKHFRSRHPRYPDDSDYKTNASSYYDDLARKNKLIEILAEKIYGYDKVLAENLAEIERVLNAVIDKIGEGFNQEIVELLEQWILDGTLDHIINETLMNKKADKTELEALETALNEAMALLETTLTTQMNEFETATDEKITELEQQVGQELDNKLDNLEESFNKKLDYSFNCGKMHQFNLQKRHQANDKSFVSVQGSCFLGGKGDNIEYALAFLPTDGNLQNQGMVVRTKGSNLISESGGTALNLYHANGMDYNPETNSIYVAHANTVTTGGATPNNQVTELDKTGQSVKRVITPKGIPAGRRVKGFSYDKGTGKKYLNDDLGVFEVDNDLNVIKQIDFSSRFTDYKSWGLGQHASVHHDHIFYLTMGAPTIAVFDMTGKLLTLYQIPKFTDEGVFVGQEPQSLFFDNDDNLYLVSRTDGIDYRLENFYTRIFKMSVFTGTAESYFVGTNNTNTTNSVYVTANPTSPFSLGSKTYPFHSLDEAVTYALTSDSQKRFQVNINLNSGNYGRSDIRTNGAKLNIIGLTDDVVFDALRFFNTDVMLENIKINNPYHDYALYLSQSDCTLYGVKIDAKNKKFGIVMYYGSNLYGINSQGNEIINCNTGIYVNGGLVLGNKYGLGLRNHAQPIETSSSGYAPQFELGEDDA